MRAKYDSLPETTQLALLNAVRRTHHIMNQQEVTYCLIVLQLFKITLFKVCSTVHGYGKMGAKWEELPRALKDCITNSMLNLGEMGELCLGCSIYALGERICHRYAWYLC